MNVRSRFATVVVGLSLALVAAPAHARIHDGDGGGSWGMGCRAIQDEYDALLRKLTDPGLSADDVASLWHQILDKARDWERLGCNEGFGSIFFREAAPVCLDEGSTACTPIDQILVDSDRDQVADLDEVFLGLDPKDPDGNRDGRIDGLDPTWLGDQIRKLPEGSVAVPDRSKPEAWLEELAVLAERSTDDADPPAVLAKLEGLLGCTYDPKDPTAQLTPCVGAEVLRVYLTID